ncbi:Centromere [Trichuris trichiura]|uniref:Centromere n=1 Tax=Trichuris trichiura TaxID=36087 RepID=A0A077Z6U1_TRITR|nr:Centromere [Trichuris trichiura]
MDQPESVVSTGCFLQIGNKPEFRKLRQHLISRWRHLDKARTGDLGNSLKERYQVLSSPDDDEFPLGMGSMASELEMELKDIETRVISLASTLCIAERRLDAIGLIKDLYQLFLSCQNVTEDTLDKFPQAYCSLQALARQVLNPSDGDDVDDEMSPDMRYSLLTCHPGMSVMFFSKILTWLSKRKRYMRQFLLRQWRATFAWDHQLESQSLTVTVKEVGKLVNLCDALETFGLLNFVISKLSSALCDVFLDRFREAEQCNLHYEASNGAHTLKTCMSPVFSMELNEEEMLRRSSAVQNFFDALSGILNVTVGNGVHLGSAVGNLLGDSLMEGIIAICLKPYVPFERNKTLIMEKQLESCRELERNFRNRRFLNAESYALQKFLLDYDSILCEKECETLISAFQLAFKLPLEPVTEVHSSLLKLTPNEINWPYPKVEGKVASLDSLLEPYHATISSVMSPSCSVRYAMVYPLNLTIMNSLVETVTAFGFTRFSVQFKLEQQDLTSSRLVLEATSPVGIPAFTYTICLVSWIVDYVERIESTLRKAFRSKSQALAIRYFEVSRTAAWLAIVLGKNHLKEASQSAYVTALSFNNMCFLARSLLEWNIDVEQKLAVAFHCSPCLFGFTYLDVAKKLRHLAVTYLNAFLECQSTQLVHDLKLASGFAKATIGGRSNICHEKIKLCLKQLLCVHSEWKTLLPGHVMRVSYGRLVDSLFTAVILNVLSLEDITSKEANGLDDSLTALMADVEFLFTSEKPPRPEAYCHTWRRMKELIFVLENNLKGIEERWNAGNGPLASCFTPDELRKLIRAIFQNTEQRAAVLSKLTRTVE